MLEALDLCLRPLDQSAWPDIAWRTSGLTSSRFPVEFGFSNHEDRLRVTFEVSPPETPEGVRLDAVLDLLSAIGMSRPDASTLAGWRALQDGQPLKWGCCMGLRQTSRGFGAKIYVEAPMGAPVARADWRAPGSRLRMLGFDFESGVSEVYFSWPRVEHAEALARWRALGLADIDALVAEIEALMDLPAASALPRARWGVSIANAEPRFAVFVNASRVRGGPASVRRRMLARPAPSYAMELGGRPVEALPNHGVITLVARPAGLEMRVGIAGDCLA
jgi:hypothetical protein